MGSTTAGQRSAQCSLEVFDVAKVTEMAAQLAQPFVEAAGCSLWDVEYVKEAGEWYLRFYIDKDGGVSINDCEAVSRPLSDALDETCWTRPTPSRAATPWRCPPPERTGH